MTSIVIYGELAVASLRLILILTSILLCIELMIKSEKMSKIMAFFMISFIPSIIYTISRILNIESLSENGKFVGLTLNLGTTIFLLLGLFYLNKQIQFINKQSEKEQPIKEKNPKQEMQVFSKFVEKRAEKTPEKYLMQKNTSERIKLLNKKPIVLSKKPSSSVLGKLVVTKNGNKIGIVKDIVFDSDSGELMNIIVKNPTFYTNQLGIERTNLNEFLVPYSSIISIGDFVIVNEEEL